MRRSSPDSADDTKRSDSTRGATTKGAASSAGGDEGRTTTIEHPRGRSDPLWIMLGVGGLLFVVETWRSPQRGDDVVITHERITASETTLRRALGREPTPGELDESLQRWIDTEIAVREARRLGLDRDDPIVRRRLVQKVEQILESTWDDRAPSRGEIDAWIAANPDRYRDEANVDLTHVFVAARAGDDPTNEAPPARVVAIHDALAGATDSAPAAAIASLVDGGDAFVHGSRLRGQSRAALVSKFGEHFTDAVFPADGDGDGDGDGDDSVGETSVESTGPDVRWRVVASKHGWHVVSVSAKRHMKDSARDVVAGQAARDWLEEQRDATREAERARLRRQYRVVREDGA